MTGLTGTDSAGARPPAWRLPVAGDAGIIRISAAGGQGIAAGVLPNGAVCWLAHEPADGQGAVMISQVAGSGLAWGIGRLVLRVGGEDAPADLLGPGFDGVFAAAGDCAVWEGRAPRDLAWRLTLRLHAHAPLWTWRLELRNHGAAVARADVLFIQDLGLGDRGFLMNNEAYASQYIDHTVVRDGDRGPVILSRQALDQGGRRPWAAHGGLTPVAGYATDAADVFGPAFRGAGTLATRFGAPLPSRVLQRETACAALLSAPVTLAPGGAAVTGFFGLFQPDHPAASGAGDLAAVTAALAACAAAPPAAAGLELRPARRSLLQTAPSLAVRALTEAEIAALWPQRLSEERIDGALASFFVPDGDHNRHVALRDKELAMQRRHGAIIRTGEGVLPADDIFCATCWMHGVFGAQLTLGNTSFHKLFSVSRDPFNITRASGLRLLVDQGDGWRLLATPSAFEISLNGCRWIYATERGRVTVSAFASVARPVLRWEVTADGAPARLLVAGHCVMGEREAAQSAAAVVDAAAGRVLLRPDPQSLWGQRYPESVYVVQAGDPAAVRLIAGSEALYDGDAPQAREPWLVIATGAVNAFSFIVTGSLTDPAAALALADEAARWDADAERAAAARYWTRLTRGLAVSGDARAQALSLAAPWLVQNALIHVSVPHGLEQYTGAAWGTRDVCQGPVEMLLALGHDAPAREIMLAVFAEQYAGRGDWSQWFMPPPYSFIRDRSSHGDVIIWPLKMVCDYIEATGDVSCLDAQVPWRNYDDASATAETAPLAGHVDVLLQAVASQYLPGTHLVRLGEGDWNDSLQPADPSLKGRMVSSWTVALLYQQLVRYAAVLERAGRPGAEGLRREAQAMRREVNALLIRDGVIAGYGLFAQGRYDGAPPELLLHPSDRRTGVRYSMLPMARAIAGGLFTPEQAERHLAIIRDHLAGPDGVRLMDRPLPYRGGVETMFRRAESAACFGREIGLMYTHAHLQYAQALAALLAAARDDAGRAALQEALVTALAQVNPADVCAVTPNASPRQRNAYFSSSDAAFDNRAQADAEWERVRAGAIAVDGGWRIYSSGPGLFLNLLARDVLGLRRDWGAWRPRGAPPPAFVARIAAPPEQWPATG
ncbi:cellobiose phosphorylase [Camelimonas abortus]|uniref:Cellobiose phosphorylase n=1 Tax=Camelimonas abortus TaxID=1017184 RepID=A0ABV7LDU8_9HYPH